MLRNMSQKVMFAMASVGPGDSVGGQQARRRAGRNP